MARRLERGSRLVLASHNPGKLAEIAELVRPHGVAVVSAAELGMPEPDETAADFVGNARVKALAAYHNGTSTIESALGEDTTVRVRLPHASVEVGTSEQAVGGASPPLKGAA